MLKKLFISFIITAVLFSIVLGIIGIAVSFPWYITLGVVSFLVLWLMIYLPISDIIDYQKDEEELKKKQKRNRFML